MPHLLPQIKAVVALALAAILLGAGAPVRLPSAASSRPSESGAFLRADLDVFATPVDFLAEAGSAVRYCVGITPGTVGDYEVTVDGSAYAGGLEECDMPTRFSYDFGPLAAGGRAPYELERWLVDGRSAAGTFDELDGLDSLMRTLDPSGNWRLKPSAAAVRGGTEESSYGELLVVDADGTRYPLDPDPFGVAAGVAVELPGAGTYAVAVERLADDCSDEVTVVVGDGSAPPPADTLPAVTVGIAFAGDGPYTACVDELDIDRPFAEAVVEGASGPYTAGPSSRNGCVLIDPSAADAAAGSVTALFCESANPTVCQRVVFAITQDATCGDEPFALEAETLDPSDDPFVYCLAGGADLTDYEIRLDGGVVQPQSVGGCGGGGGGGTVAVYAYNVLNIEDVDYRIDAWDVNGNSLIREDTEGGLQGVADSMSAFDPARDWTYDADLGLIHTTEVAGNYSPILVLFDYRFGAGPTAPLITAEIPDDEDGGNAMGSAITLPGPGTFEVEVYNAALDCGDRISLTVPPATPPSTDTIRLVVEGDRGNGPFCVPVDELPGDIANFTICGAPQNGTVRAEAPAGCFSYRADGFVGEDTLCVVACTDRPALCDTTVYLIEVRPELPPCTELLAVSSLVADVQSCDAATDVCLPALRGDASNYGISVDGVPRADVAVCGTARLTVFDYDPIVAFATPAGFTVQGFVVDGATFSGDAPDVAALVDSLDAWDPAGGWALDFAERRLIGGAPGSSYGDLVIAEAGGGSGSATLPATARDFDNRVSVPLTTGSYQVLVSDLRTGCSQTLDLEVRCGCARPLPAAFSRGIDCSTSEIDVCLPVLPEVLASYTLTVDGGVYGGPVSPCGEQVLLVIDALELYGSPNPPVGPTPFRIDSITIDGETFSADVPGGVPELAQLLDDWDSSASWRYDDEQQLIVGGSTSTQYSSLSVSGGTLLADAEPREIVLEPTLLPTGSRITLPAGAGARALALDDGTGCAYDIALTLVCVQANVRADTIDVLETELFCVDESELTGPVARVFDACPGAGGAVAFDFDAPAGCFTATGLAPGSTTGCIVACDVNGVCDTTSWTITVNPEASGIRAIDDAFGLRVDEPLTERVTDNDVFGTLSTVRILVPPVRGVAELLGDGTLTYTPELGACGFTDSLRYEICSGQNCSEANVYLRVRCGLVEAYDGFSPNGDGVNETFVVMGIEAYPEASVRVFNRWGNLVYEAASGYGNDWRGDWDGERLPAGTYFYLVAIPGEEEVAGSLQLWR